MCCPIIRTMGVCLYLSIISTLVCAQPSLPEDRPAIDLSEALARALARNPELAVLGYQVEAAEGMLLQAGLAPNPELGVIVEDVFGTDNFNGVERAQTTVTLGWVLERGKRQRRIDAARDGVSLSTDDADIMRLDVAAQTARQFLVCLAYQGRIVNAAEAVRLAGETVAAVSRRVAASRTPDAELARAEAELARAELLAENYEHELLSAYHLLGAQWGETRPDFGSVNGDLQTLPVLEPLETLLASAGENPELARFMSQQRLDESELLLARARGKPNWRVYAGLRRFEAVDDVAFVAGITVPLAVRNQNQGRIAEARAELARTEAETEAARVRVNIALFVFYQELLHNIHLVERLRKDVIPRIERALVGTQRAYELGRYSYFELSVVQEELLQANNELLEASVDAHRIVIEIERLTGVRVAASAPTQ